MDNSQARVRELGLFFERGHIRKYDRGQALVNPYDYSKDAFYIESGFVKVYSSGRRGVQNLLCILSRGDILPFPGAFGVYKVESYYIAMSNVVVRCLPASVLLRAVKQNSAILQAMLWQIYSLLMTYSNRVNTLDLRGLDERVASFLLLLDEQFGVNHGLETIIDIPITHQEIADAIATTRESVSRTLSLLARQGVIEQRNRLIVITNRQALEDILS